VSTNKDRHSSDTVQTQKQTQRETHLLTHRQSFATSIFKRIKHKVKFFVCLQNFRIKNFFYQNFFILTNIGSKREKSTVGYDDSKILSLDWLNIFQRSK